MLARAAKGAAEWAAKTGMGTDAIGYAKQGADQAIDKIQ